MVLKSQKIISIFLLAAYLVLVVVTMINHEFLIELVSPIVAIMSAVLILMCMSRLEIFRIPAILLTMGILSWAIADTIKFVNHFILHTEPMSLIVRNTYLLPNYFFAATICYYLKLKLSKKDLIYVVINTFLLSTICFTVLRRLMDVFMQHPTLLLADKIRAYGYMLINFFIMIIAGQLIGILGLKRIWKGLSLTISSILIYIAVDFQYTYFEIIGVDPENIFIDLIYMLCMIMMAIGVYFHIEKQYTYEFKERDYTEDIRKWVIVVAAILFAGGIVATVVGFFTKNELLYLVLAGIAYVMMRFMLRNIALSEKLLSQQTEVNSLLEEQVAIKTRDLREVNESLEKLSSVDALTGLYNRRYGTLQIKNMIEDSKKYESEFALFSIDLNHFKHVNDTYGHDMGDRVLKEIGNRMLKLPGRFIPIRMGGDEFLVIMRGIGNREDINHAAALIQNLFNSPIEIDTYIFNLSASIGISCYPKDAADPEMLLQYADAAMYMVKKSGNKDGFKFSDRKLVKTVEDRKRLEDFLSKAEPDMDFRLLYQPQVDMRTGKVIGVEVFPRIKETDMSIYSASDIIPIAEEIGIMSRLGIWIAGTAIERVQRWGEMYGIDISVTLNLSPLQLLDGDFIEKLEYVAESKRIDKSGIILDVANDVMLGAAESAKETLRFLNEAGYTLSINDFGGGDINLSYITDCGFNIIKISRSLVAGAVRDPDVFDIIKAVVSMKDSLSYDVYAIGVETKEQADLVKSIGINTIQGYYFGKPCSDIEFEDQFLRNHQLV